MDEILARALVGGVGLAVAAGPFGCLVVWRRMAYFGDTLAHTTLLGGVVGMWLGVAPLAGIALLCVLVAVMLALGQEQRRLASDTLLGIVSHGTLASGLVALSLMPDVRVNLTSWLLGDILALGWGDVAAIWGGGAIALVGLAFLWRSLVASAVDEDLAAVEGHAIARTRVLLMVLIALVVAVAIKVVGVLLVTALLVVPAASARRFARTPEQMAGGASLVGVLAMAAGMGASWWWDTPTGPSVVVALVGLFLVVR